MIQVYYAPPSIYGRKVLTVLAEKQLDYTIVPMSFAEKDHQKAEYLKINPNGEYPAIVDDDRVLYESTAVCEYLDEEYPIPALMPEDTYERARVRIVDDFCDLHLYRSLVKYMVKKRKDETPLPEDEKAIADDLGRIETYLEGSEYLVGGRFTLADCAFMPAVATAEALGLGKLLQRSKPFDAYVASLKARPSWAQANLLKLA